MSQNSVQFNFSEYSLSNILHFKAPVHLVLSKVRVFKLHTLADVSVPEELLERPLLLFLASQDICRGSVAPT